MGPEGGEGREAAAVGLGFAPGLGSRLGHVGHVDVVPCREVARRLVEARRVCRGRRRRLVPARAPGVSGVVASGDAARVDSKNDRIVVRVGDEARGADVPWQQRVGPVRHAAAVVEALQDVDRRSSAEASAHADGFALVELGLHVHGLEVEHVVVIVVIIVVILIVVILTFGLLARLQQLEAPLGLLQLLVRVEHRCRHVALVELAVAIHVVLHHLVVGAVALLHLPHVADRARLRGPFPVRRVARHLAGDALLAVPRRVVHRRRAGSPVANALRAVHGAHVHGG